MTAPAPGEIYQHRLTGKLVIYGPIGGRTPPLVFSGVGVWVHDITGNVYTGADYFRHWYQHISMARVVPRAKR
jgi:hypothetical protein